MSFADRLGKAKDASKGVEALASPLTSMRTTLADEISFQPDTVVIKSPGGGAGCAAEEGLNRVSMRMLLRWHLLACPAWYRA